MTYAEPQFPILSGRVVDEAHLLTSQATQTIENQLENYETQTSIQVVVVTLPDLGGYTIDDYGYQLGRHWQLGQKGKNNGIILILALKERKVRIEVGYGLEPVMTDLLANQIIQNVMVPQLKNGDYQQALIDGVDSILKVLGGGKVTPAKSNTSESSWLEWIFFIVMLFLILRNPSLALISAGSGSRFGGRGGGSGGFTGGGGSFGGGGSSGSW